MTWFNSYAHYWASNYFLVVEQWVWGRGVIFTEFHRSAVSNEAAVLHAWWHECGVSKWWQKGPEVLGDKPFPIP